MSSSTLEQAAFTLYVVNMFHYDVDRTLAQMEWDLDDNLRAFWIGQVRVVQSALGCTCE